MRLPSWLSCNLTRFWNLATLKYTVVVGLCLWSVRVHLQYRVPGAFLSVLLPAIGAAMAVLSLTLLVNHLLIRVPDDDPFRQTLGRIEWGASLVVRIFVYGSLFLYANGLLDRSAPGYRPADIVTITRGVDLDLPVSYSWVTVRDRDTAGKTERLMLRWSERNKLWGAEPVVLKFHEGYFGIPWVADIERDEDHYAREILKLTPTAANAWKKLISFDLAHERWNEAVTAAREYLKLYPKDYHEAIHVASTLDMYDRFSDAIPFYEQGVAGRPTYENYQMFGATLSYAGKKLRAAEVLERSIPLNPDYWEAYYHLGYVYADLGRQEEAVAMFKKVLERNPNFPEVETEIAKLKEAILAQHAAQQRRKSKESP